MSFIYSVIVLFSKVDCVLLKYFQSSIEIDVNVVKKTYVFLNLIGSM